MISNECTFWFFPFQFFFKYGQFATLSLFWCNGWVWISNYIMSGIQKSSQRVKISNSFIEPLISNIAYHYELPCCQDFATLQGHRLTFFVCLKCGFEFELFLNELDFKFEPFMPPKDTHAHLRIPRSLKELVGRCDWLWTSVHLHRFLSGPVAWTREPI